jgi:hypothetical protein
MNQIRVLEETYNKKDQFLACSLKIHESSRKAYVEYKSISYNFYFYFKQYHIIAYIKTLSRDGSFGFWRDGSFLQCG